MINLKHAFYLSRLRLAMVICLIGIIVGILLRYFNMVEATVEQTTVGINLNSMINLLHSQSVLLSQTDRNCIYLNDPDLFPQANNANTLSPQEQQSIGYWQYNAKRHQLTYLVRSKGFFRSVFNHKIVVDLYCKKGVVQFRINPHKWCKDMRLWGCAEW